MLGQPFPTYDEILIRNFENEKNFPLLYHFTDLLRNICSKKPESCMKILQNLKKAIGKLCTKYLGNYQEDSIEFMRNLINFLINDYNEHMTIKANFHFKKTLEKPEIVIKTN